MLYNIRLLNILWWFNFNSAPPERSPKRIRACLVASHNWKPFEQCMNQEKKGERLDKIFTRRWGRMAAAILFICRLPTVLFSPFFSWFRCLHIVGRISMEYALIALTNYDECGIVYCSGRNKQRKRMKGVWKNWPPAFCFFTHFMDAGCSVIIEVEEKFGLIAPFSPIYDLITTCHSDIFMSDSD